MKSLTSGPPGLAPGMRKPLLSRIGNLRLAAVWTSASFTATFIVCAMAIHAFGYRVMALKPVNGSATIARDLVRRHPDLFTREMRQALRHHPSAAATIERD